MLNAASVILDAWGNPYPAVPPAAEALAVRTPDRLRDRASLGSILTSVTPARLAAIFAEADQGMIGRQIELAEDIEERDGHLISQLQTRRLAVTGLDWIVQPGDEAAGSQLAAEWCREWLDEECLQALLDRLLDAILGQWAIDQVHWRTGGMRAGKPYWHPEGFRQVDARRLAWPQVEGERVAVPGLMRAWNPADLEPITPGSYIAHSYRVNRSRPGKRALVRAVAAIWMVKRFAMIDFANLVEKWGIPFLVVQYAQGSSDAEIGAILERLVTAGAHKIAAVPMGSAVETEGSSAQISSLPQRELIRLCDEIISKAIIGSTTISDAAGNNDSVSSPTHGDVRRLIRDADAKSLAATINRDLVRPWFAWNRPHFPADARSPKLAPTLAEKEAPEKRGAVYVVAKQLGLKVKSDQLYEDLGIEKPDDVEEVIELKAEAPASPFGGGFGFPLHRRDAGATPGQDSGEEREDRGDAEDAEPQMRNAEGGMADR